LPHQRRCNQHTVRAIPIAELADALTESSNLLPAAGVAALVLPIAGIAGWRFSLYSQLEVIRAKTVGNLVPSKARYVMQLGGTTKDLYYYPKTIGQVMVVGEDIQPLLFEQVGSSAGTPTLARKGSVAQLGFTPDASVDCVMSLNALGGLSEQQRQQAVREVIRVLKPGGFYVFIEPLTDEASPLRALISATDASKAMAASQLEDLLDNTGLDVKQVDVALAGQDPHAVGLARRTTAPAGSARSSTSSGSRGDKGPKGGDGDREALRKAAREGSGAQKGEKKGFASSSSSSSTASPSS